MSDSTPDRRKITDREAQRLADLSGVSIEKLEGRSLVELQKDLQWKIDPRLFTHRLVCGRVVKENPATGELEGVPGATVTAYDTDGSFLAHVPRDASHRYPLVWLWPLKVRREVLATAVTDACGKFCLWIPRFDIDWFVRWRLRRHCHFHFLRPRIKDVLFPNPKVDLDPGFIDPVPEFERKRPVRSFGDLIRKAGPTAHAKKDFVENAAKVAPEAIAKEVREIVEVGAGLAQMPLEECLELPVFRDRLAPPPVDARRLEKLELPVKAELLGQLDPRRVIGPYWVHCHLHAIPEWYPVLDVPDITFGVTQDVDGDGDQETIYSEGFFEVRWDADSNDLDNLVLHADDTAISAPGCGPVRGILCQDEPVISTAGYMSLDAAYHDDGTGYALRPNGPSTNGLDAPPIGAASPAGDAEAPYRASLNLHGCHRIGDADRYRVLYRHEGGAEQPFLGLSWYNPRKTGVGAPIHVVPDAEGWYPILDANLVAHPNWLLWWPTHLKADGEYEVRLELGRVNGGGIQSLGHSDPRTIRVDNSQPLVSMTARWRKVGAMAWTDLDLSPCPRIERGGEAVELEVSWSASAAHLRNAVMSASGCGGGTFITGPVAERAWWWSNPNLNSVNKVARFELPADRPPGCYGLHLSAFTRAFNPSGFDHGPHEDWYIHQAQSRRDLHYSISIVD